MSLLCLRRPIKTSYIQATAYVSQKGRLFEQFYFVCAYTYNHIQICQSAFPNKPIALMRNKWKLVVTQASYLRKCS